MSRVDLFLERRRIIETMLDILAALTLRLNTGEPLPNPLLAELVEFLRELEDTGYGASQASEGNPALSACVAHHDTARLTLSRLQWALESLERGEAGAVGAFVINAREYVRLLREHMRMDDRFFPMRSAAAPSNSQRNRLAEQTSDADWTPEQLVARRRCDRLVERYASLTRRSPPQQ